MIESLRRIPLRRFEDGRGWFVELNRASWHEKPMRQTNVSFSKAGVIRGLHYHERGQDDLFVCLEGTARVVVLDLSSGETSRRTSATRPRLRSTSPAAARTASRP